VSENAKPIFAEIAKIFAEIAKLISALSRRARHSLERRTELNGSSKKIRIRI
jgi:hypothetical protein